MGQTGTMRGDPSRHAASLARLGLIAARGATVDVANLLRYGTLAPRVSERIWIDPLACAGALADGVELGRSGRVVGGDWDLAPLPLVDVPHIRMCLAHWRDGVPWERTGAYEELLRAIEEDGGSHGGCSTLADVVRRYERLDELLEEVRGAGGLAPRSEIGGPHWRERGGILMHVGRGGVPIFNGWGGCHRLAIALHLKLDLVPAQLGMVHPAGIDALPALRTPPA